MFTSRSVVSSAVVAMGALFTLSCGDSDVIVAVNGVPDTLQIVSIDVANGAATLTELSLVIGDTAALTATAFNALRQPLGNADIFWTSSSAGVASVSTEGVVVALAIGETTISASADSFAAHVPTIVSADAQQIVSIEVRNGPTVLGQLRLGEGETATLTATAFNAFGDPLGVEIVWASSSPGVASVSTQGVVTALAAGSTTISATAGAVVANVPTTVSEVGDPPVGVGGLYDPYLPAAWSDTVHYEDFTAIAAPLRFDVAWDQGRTGPDPFTGALLSWSNQCVGGAGNSGYGGANCDAQDSVVFANQPSPPWVWENYLQTNSGGALEYEINFVDGNGPSAAANLTRLYIRYSIFFEDAAVGIGRENYVWQSVSNKYFNMNEIGNGFIQLWYDQAAYFWGQSSPNTDNGCRVGLPPNTWVDYYPADTVPPQNAECSAVGQGGHGKTGVWQHHFVCFDFSPSAGSRVMSWGMSSADEQGIAGYHDNVTNYDAVPGSYTDFSSFIWNGTWGGEPKTHPAMSYWFDDILIMTGPTGSCVTPPSFTP
jgi:Big-like domain-containing protein